MQDKTRLPAAQCPPLPDFDPVPRKSPRHDGWTPERQRAFIEALADTGCVKIAARMVNMSSESAYLLRRQPAATSFRQAWDAAQNLGLQVVRDEAFDRAMNGQLVPVFVAGKLMGFRRKKNDRLLMFILRHYGQDSTGRRTTINYFSTRATAAAGAAAPRDAGSGRPTTGEAVSIDVTNSVRDGGSALAAAESSTTTVKTIISGAAAQSQLAADHEAAAILNAFEGVPLDAEAQDQIYRALAACAERRRALEQDPENDPERVFIAEEETNGYLGALESGFEQDGVEVRPEGEHSWESLGEGGSAAEIDKVLAEIAERRAKLTPAEIAAEKAEHEAEFQRMREQQQHKALPAPDLSPDDPMLDWRNWSEDGYVAPSPIPKPARPEPRSGVEEPIPVSAEAEAPISPRTGKPLKRYKKRTPKPAFAPPEPALTKAWETHKAEAIAEVEADRRELAAGEAERRKQRKRRET